MAEIHDTLKRALRSLIPPEKLRLSDWIEKNVELPEGVSALKGRVRLWPPQREIADAIGDPLIERVTLVKSVRVGFTTLLTSAMASYIANDPSPILSLLPTESDCRDYMVSDVEPIFDASPALEGLLTSDEGDGKRNTMMSRRFPGGSLKVVAAKSPRNLRRHNVRVLFMDEVDGMEVTKEGSPLLLAERRTLSFPDRKIVMGSTPVYEETSAVLASYFKSDQRIYEVPCPDCSAFAEMLWDHIRWDEGKPETARWCCPACGSLVSERMKSQMVAEGRWRPMRPEVEGHAGFRMNALVSFHANASWGKLAREFVENKNDPTLLQTFVNTILAQGWKVEGEELSEEAMMARAEPFNLDLVPAEVLAMTVGVDVQHDRLEVTFLGWTEGGVCLVLAHRVIWGRWENDDTWAELDDVLSTQHPHALGGKLGPDAVAIDSGDGTTMDKVLDFCASRSRKKVYPIKGDGGNRPAIQKTGSKTKKLSRLWIVGVDTLKSQVFGRLERAGPIRFSADLPPIYYEQLASERVVVRYRRGQPSRLFERVPGRRAEALDCLVYATAIRGVVNFNPEKRREQLAQVPAHLTYKPKPTPADDWMGARGENY